MKQFTLFIVLLLTVFSQQAESKAFQSKAAQVTIINKTGKKCYFQQEGINGYDLLSLDAQGQKTLSIDLQSPAYYQYMNEAMRNYTVYLTPGSKTNIIENTDGISIE